MAHSTPATTIAYLTLALASALAATACKKGEPARTGAASPAIVAVEDRLPAPAVDLPLVAGPSRTAVFAGGCFWCTEAVFEELAGVGDVIAGYAGGDRESATYRVVSRGDTGHAEAIQIPYDPGKISYGTLLRVFFATHDPTQLDRQGPDVGKQYRSAVFYTSDDEKRVAMAYIEQLQAAHAFDRPIVTTLEPLTGFHAAESYHQDYARLNPDDMYIQIHARAKVDKLHKRFPELLDGNQGSTGQGQGQSTGGAGSIE